MGISELHKDIVFGKICPYCKSGTKTISETDVYGKEYKGRKIICCKNFPYCDSYVGTHDDVTPLGRLANKELRMWKRRAHDVFDRIWKEKLMDRNDVYDDLAEHLGMPREYCHIGMFKKDTCIETIKFAQSKLRELR